MTRNKGASKKPPLVFVNEYDPMSPDEMREALHEIYQILKEELDSVLTLSDSLDTMEVKSREVGR
jgi:hypothetical protein